MCRFYKSATSTLALVTLLATPIAYGQSVQKSLGEQKSQTSALLTVQGRVSDSLKHPIAQAKVCLNSHDAQTITVHTDLAGAYLFSAVPQGAYILSAERAGYKKAESSLVLGSQDKTINFTLELAKIGDQGKSSTERPDFFDEPNFTVAGVTDTTSLGGHGSDVIVKNKDAVAGATVALKSATPSNSDDESERYHQLAEAAEKRSDPLEAVRDYQRAAELNPIERNLFDWGVELLTHHAPEPAIEVFNKGNRLFPQSVRMLEGLGAAWYSLGSYEQAAQHFCDASDLNPEDSNPYLFMGKMQAAEGMQSPEIEQHLARFVVLQPQNPWANYYYAVTLQKRRKSVEDVENVSRITSLLRTAVGLDPKFSLAYLELGTIYEEQKYLPKAVSALQDAVKADPSLEEAHYRLARAYKQSGEISKAHTELQVYEQISKEKTAAVERQRHEMQQFVYELRDRSPAPQP
jgi:tetratricopeptide (TPR) repeat protein